MTQTLEAGQTTMTAPRGAPITGNGQANGTDMSAVIAVFNTHQEAESAIRELQKSGFDMKKLSIIGKGYHTEENVVGYYSVGDRMKSWGSTGAFWGGIWSLMFGSAFFLVPGIGPLLAAGPIVLWIVGALESAAVVGGLSALGAALFSIGIPKDSIVEYETQVKRPRRPEALRPAPLSHRAVRLPASTCKYLLAVALVAYADRSTEVGA